MPTIRTAEAALASAASQGDPRACEELLAGSLPLIWTIVRRALPDHPDAEDVVQETVLAALRDLPSLQDPNRFRSWLAVIAVRQVAAHRRRCADHDLVIDLDEAAEVPDDDLPPAVRATAQAELTAQRRLVARAGRWLDPDDQVLLSLWWLETAERMTREELAAAVGVTTSHAAVRVQRMRARLDACRTLVSALDRQPRCPGLEQAATGWDGMPSPLWRKRLSRHVRGCARCGRAGAEQLPAEWLLTGLALLPVPVTLGAWVAAKTAAGTAISVSAAASSTALAGAGTGVGAGAAAVDPTLVWRALRAMVGHPVAAATVGTMITGVAVTTAVFSTDLPLESAPPPAVVVSVAPTPTITVTQTPKAVRVTAAPSSAGDATAAPPVEERRMPGKVSLQAAGYSGRFVMVGRESHAKIAFPDLGDVGSRTRATLDIVPGLADRRCLSLRLADGRYLRHRQWRLEAWNEEPTPLFRADATFCPRPSSVDGAVQLRSLNYPDRALRHRGFWLWVEPVEPTPLYALDSAWRVEAPLEP